MPSDTPHRWGDRLAAFLGRRNIPLLVAASRLRQRSRSQFLAHSAADATDQELTHGCALILLDSEEIAVLGKKPQSTILERIARIDLEASVLSEDATVLKEASDPGRTLFTDLAVDLEKFTRFLSDLAPIEETNASSGKRAPSSR